MPCRAQDPKAWLEEELENSPFAANCIGGERKLQGIRRSAGSDAKEFRLLGDGKVC